MTNTAASKLIEKGTWTWGAEGVDWELHASRSLPSITDCTAAFCVAITDDQKILLEHEERGWGMIGGHIDDGESVEAALVRECQEEGGFTPHKPTLFAYRKIIATKPVTHPEPGRSYPFPISYIAYYWAITNAPITEPTEPEVLETNVFTVDEVASLGVSDASAIKLGWESYLHSLAS